MRCFIVLAAASLASVSAAFPDSSSFRAFGPQGINLWKLDVAREKHSQKLLVDHSIDSQTSGQLPLSAAPNQEFPEHYFTQPLDHFSNSSHTFGQRYWINTRHYKPGTAAPVIVLDGGETSGEDRIPFLDTGIVEILARATGGVGVVLEHRYYGNSVPVENFTTDSLRWLNNEQSAADSAYFMANVKFPGVDEDLTAPSHPWIYYGGSYAGARAAHMKILYPDLVYGAIASSGVTHADFENWRYMDIIRRAAEPECSANLVHSVEFIDTVLSIPHLRIALKQLFGLKELEHDEDFVSLLSSPMGYWQAKVWDPSVGSTGFEEFCAALSKPLGSGDLTAHEVIGYNVETQMIALPGGLNVPKVVYNYAQFIKENYVSRCPEGTSVDECFGTYDDSAFQDTSLDATWRLWQFQVCTQWGYFFNAPPPEIPSIVSRRLTVDYEAKTCKQAYTPGEHFIVPSMPNITAVNILGDYYIAADRLAIIDGEVDPWRPDTPHADEAPLRADTILRPYKVIPGGVHHYDEYGLRDLSAEPPEIEKIHLEMIEFVTEWLKDWQPPKRKS
ncbi:serine carboxypeptidase S28-domain-containing protein [Fomitopsis serialis]|uniref:serine carboxypeptidase S28-domain-containing protein n=1 Tax=Fomitopsis serialis TaxID=139415 RepID=UPI0020081D0F|nr:serine carboxypeptidase S28-domain-containing protein [Neoantrodia serialis]KAH9936342.1 serine carboxypeptidase S28-domain-containing protein [Neoantrodia serialis]